MQVSPGQIQEYRERGYLVLPGFIPASTIGTMVAEIERSMRDPEVFASHRSHFQFARNPVENRHYVLQALHAERLSPALQELLRSPGVVELVTAFLGPDIGLFQAKLVFKQANGGAEVPWHQDFAYWNSFSKEPLQLNFGIYLDDTSLENGCLEVIPGSHAAGLRVHDGGAERMNFANRLKAAPEDRQAVPLEGPKGTVVLFTALTMHRSQVNFSGRRRLFLNMVFTPLGNDSIPVPVIARREPGPGDLPAPDVERIPAIYGKGPHGGQCEAQYRNRELWKQAVRDRDPALRGWVYVHANQAADTAPEWFTARMDGSVGFVHFRNGGDAFPERANVRFLSGDLQARLLDGSFDAALAGADLGILVLQTRDPHTVKSVLAHFEPRLRAGSLLLLEAFFDGADWREGPARALLGFAREAALTLRYLARTERGLLARIVSKGEAREAEYATELWKPRVLGIQSGFGIPASAPPPTTLNPVKGLKRLLRPWREDSFPSPYYRDFFPKGRIPQFKGGDLPGPACGTHLRRKELWRYALSFVENPALAWCEFGVGEGESLDWWALNKPAENHLFGFDSFEGIPEDWNNVPKGQWKTDPYDSKRDDVNIVAGLYDASLSDPALMARLGPQIGFLHVDCDLYSSTRVVFTRLRDLIGPGTVIVFDELYGYGGWQTYEARAFREFAGERGLEFEYLARSDFQAAVRVLKVGVPVKVSTLPQYFAVIFQVEAPAEQASNKLTRT